MSKLKTLSESTRLIVLTIITVAIVGVLGYAYYLGLGQNQSQVQNQNQDQNSTNTTETPKITKPGVPLNEIASDKSMGTNLAFKYPSDWTIDYKSHESTGYPDSSYDKSVVTSADGKISVHFAASTYTGLSVSDCSGVSMEVVERGEISGLTGAGFVAYKVTTTPNGGSVGYKYFIGAQSRGNIDNIAKSCEGYAENMTRSNTNSALGGSLLNFYVTLNDYKVSGLNKGFNAPNGFDIFNNEINTDNYQVAKQIIQSLYIKS